VLGLNSAVGSNPTLPARNPNRLQRRFIFSPGRLSKQGIRILTPYGNLSALPARNFKPSEKAVFVLIQLVVKSIIIME
jgi:hypothetical protein